MTTTRVLKQVADDVFELHIVKQVTRAEAADITLQAAMMREPLQVIPLPSEKAAEGDIATETVDEPAEQADDAQPAPADDSEVNDEGEAVDSGDAREPIAPYFEVLAKRGLNQWMRSRELAAACLAAGWTSSSKEPATAYNVVRRAAMGAIEAGNPYIWSKDQGRRKRFWVGLEVPPDATGGVGVEPEEDETPSRDEGLEVDLFEEEAS